MKNIYTKIKGHLRDNTTLVTKHLCNNAGDGYIWFLFMTVAFLLIFGALFTVMSTAINMREVRTGVDQATMDMFAEIRKLDYQELVDGNSDYAGYGNGADIWWESSYPYEYLANHLNATYDNTGLTQSIYKLDTKGNLEYKIENVKCALIDDADLFREDMYDFNSDGYVDTLDLDMLIRFIDGEDVPEFENFNPDINMDYDINQADIAMMNAIVEYYMMHQNSDPSQQRSSVIIIISVDVTVPIQFGSIDFGDNTDTYVYHSSLSFKPAQ